MKALASIQVLSRKLLKPLAKCGLFWVLCAQLFAASAQEPMKEFTIGVEAIDYYPHFDFLEKERGIAKELLDLFAHKYNYRFKYIPLPIKRFDKWLMEHEIDFKYPDNVRWRDPKGEYPTTYFSDDIYKLTAASAVHKNNLGRKRNDIKNVGTILGFHPTLWLDRIAEGEVVIIEDSNALSLVRQTRHGIIDALSIDISVINYHQRRLGGPIDIVYDPTLPHQEYGFQFSTLQHPEVIQEFNQFLRDNQAEIKALIEKYGIDENPIKKSPLPQS